MKTIEDAAFEKCQSLPSANFSNGLKSIGGDAFKGCTQLTTVDLPVTIKEIGGSAFQECPALRTVTVNSPAPPSITGDTFKKSNPVILIPKGSRPVYDADKKWYKQKGVKENK